MAGLFRGFLLVGFLLAATTAHGFTIVRGDCSEVTRECLERPGTYIHILGPIHRQDAEVFAAIDKALPPGAPLPRVYIDSTGGDLFVSMTVGRILRARKASIEGRSLQADKEANCSSGCTIIAAGAIERQFDIIEVHQPSSKAGEIGAYLAARGELVAYLKEMGMHRDFIKATLETPHSEIMPFLYVPQEPPEQQEIIKFGFRMRDNVHRPDLPTLPEHDGMSTREILEALIALGQPRAALWLAFDHSPTGSEPDPDLYVLNMTRAVEAGDSVAAHNLAVAYANGRFLKKNEKRAVELYRMAAESGFAGSQNNLGWMLYKGRGGARSIPDAVHWITRAAEQGEPFAYGSLGEMHMAGDVFVRDDVQAFKWLTLAVRGLPDGKVKEDTRKLLDRVRKRMKPDQITKAERLADEWKPLRQTDRLMGNP